VLFVNAFRRATSPPVSIALITNNPVGQGRLGLVRCFVYFDKNGADQQHLARIAAITDILTSKGRTIAQRALAWIWAKQPACIPIPGIRTLVQAKENIAAMQFGALTTTQLAQIDTILNDYK